MTRLRAASRRVARFLRTALLKSSFQWRRNLGEMRWKTMDGEPLAPRDNRLERPLLAITSCLALLAANCSRSPQQKAAMAMRLGEHAAQAQDYSRAVLQFEIAAKLLPKDAEPLYRLALVYLETGDVTTAEQALVKAGTVDPLHAASQSKLAQLIALHDDPLGLEHTFKETVGFGSLHFVDVPEDDTFLLVGSGLCAVALLLRFRSKRINH